MMLANDIRFELALDKCQKAGSAWVKKKGDTYYQDVLTKTDRELK